MIIAIDGPAASGKGTIARRLAAHYDLPHLDTGLLYRAVGLSLSRAGGDPGSDPADPQGSDRIHQSRHQPVLGAAGGHKWAIDLGVAASHSASLGSGGVPLACLAG